MITNLCSRCVLPDACFVTGACLLDEHDRQYPQDEGVTQYPPDREYDCEYTDSANIEEIELPSIPENTNEDREANPDLA